MQRKENLKGENPPLGYNKEKTSEREIRRNKWHKEKNHRRISKVGERRPQKREAGSHAWTSLQSYTWFYKAWEDRRGRLKNVLEYKLGIRCLNI